MGDTVNCPKCGEAMEKGYMFNGRRDTGIPWQPESEKYPMILSKNAVTKRGGIMRAGLTFTWAGARVTTYICRKCRKGILDY